MRLTHYDEHKKCWQINDDYGAVMIDELNYAVGEAIAKLAAYEDAEEQGLLVRLPCKVGDTVFYNFLNKTYKGKLNKVVYHGAGIQVYFSDCDGDNTSLPITKVYGSREEAEAAL